MYIAHVACMRIFSSAYKFLFVNFFVTCFARLVVLECKKKLAFLNILVLLRFLYLHSYILYSSFTESLCKNLNLNRHHTCHLQACVYVLHAFMFLCDTNICTDVTCTYVCMSVTCTHVYGCMRGWDSIKRSTQLESSVYVYMCK
jgi:hypothetical protein